MNFVAAVYVHAAVPQSQLLRPRPNCACSSPRMFCGYDVRFALEDVDDLVLRGRVDLVVVLVRAIAVAEQASRRS